MSPGGVTLGHGEEEGTSLGGHAHPCERVWSRTPTRRHADTPGGMLLRAHRAAARVAVGAAARRLGTPAADAVAHRQARAGGVARGCTSLKLGPCHRASVSARTVKLTLTPALSAACLVWLRRHQSEDPTCQRASVSSTSQEAPPPLELSRVTRADQRGGYSGYSPPLYLSLGRRLQLGARCMALCQP